MSNKLYFSLAILFFSISASAQYFVQPIESFSKSKTAFVTLKDGKSMEGKIKKIKSKNGFIQKLSIQVDKHIMNYSSNEIEFMILPQKNSRNSFGDNNTEAIPNNWSMNGYSKEMIEDGYGYFELASITDKDKKVETLLQLLNPSFCDEVKVYHDPKVFVTNTHHMIGYAAQGQVTSLYTKVGDEPVLKLWRSDYEKQFDTFFNESIVEEIKEEEKDWENFQEVLYSSSQDRREK